MTTEMSKCPPREITLPEVIHKKTQDKMQAGIDELGNPIRIERGDYVCFIGGKNEDDIFFGRVTDNPKKAQIHDKENQTQFLASFRKKFNLPPVIRVQICEEFGHISKNQIENSSRQVFVDEDKVVIIHSHRIHEGFQVHKDGNKGQIQKFDFSTKMAHIKIYGMDAVIPFVKAADLMPPLAYKVRAGQVILLDDWIGEVKLINRHFTIRTQDNTITEWEMEETAPLVIQNGDGHWNPYEAFFVGQWIQLPQLDEEKYGMRVRRLYNDGSGFLLRCSDVPQETILQPPNEFLWGIVESITISVVKIEWMKTVPGSTMLKPKEAFFKTEVLPLWENLKVLDHLSGDFVRIGSNRLYKVKKDDKILTQLDSADVLMKTWFPRKSSCDDEKQRSTTAVEQIKEGEEYRVEVILLYSGIEVAWDDGCTSFLSAPELHKCIFACPIEMAEFRIGCIVESRLPLSSKNVFGVVRKVFLEDFTLVVKWFCLSSHGGLDCMGSKHVSCFDVVRLAQEPRPLSSLVLTGGAWPNECRWSYPFGKLCVVRKDNLINTFKAAVVLNHYYADLDGKITAYCGNEVLSLSPFEVKNAEKIFEAKKPFKKKLNKAVLVSKTCPAESLESISFERIDKVDEEASGDKLKSFIETSPTNLSILHQAPKHHYFSDMPLDLTKASLLRENSKQLLVDLKKSEGLSDIWVCIYEDRPDLMSILVAGKHGTPYFGGLFAFELCLTVDFPREVPLVVYIGPVSLPNPVMGHFDNSERVCSLLGVHDSFHSDWRIKWDPKNCSFVDFMKLLHSSIHLPNSKLHDGLPEKSSQAMFNGFCITEILSTAYKILKEPSTLEQWGPRLEKEYPLVVLSLMESVRRWTSDSNEDEPEFDLLPLSTAIKLAIETRLELLRTLDAVKNVYAKKSS